MSNQEHPTDTAGRVDCGDVNKIGHPAEPSTFSNNLDGPLVGPEAAQELKMYLNPTQTVEGEKPSISSRPKISSWPSGL